MCITLYIYICVCVCVAHACTCVCVVCVFCVCVCVCVNTKSNIMKYECKHLKISQCRRTREAKHWIKKLFYKIKELII
jgi:hypothetical protein